MRRKPSRTRTGSRSKNPPVTCTSPTSARTRCTSSTRVATRSTSRRWESNALTHSFSFPSVYGSPAAIAVDNSSSPSDPSAGDLYVMDGGHGVIDKFSPEGKYLSQIGGLRQSSSGSAVEGELLGLGVDGSGTVHVDLSTSEPVQHVLLIDEFDDAAVNHLIASQELAEPRTRLLAIRASPVNPRPTASPSPPRAMTTRCSNRRARVRPRSGRSSPRSVAWTAAERATSRWPSIPRPATSTRTISPPWPSGTRAR